jgi:hypothetical protein
VSLPLAHLVPTGLGPWGDGMARLFLEPTELLLVIGLVLLGVQARQPCRDRLPQLMPLAWSLGGLIGLTLPSELLLALPCTALVAVVGLLVVLEVRLRPVVLLPLAAALALLFALAAGSALIRSFRCAGRPAGGDRGHRSGEHPSVPIAGAAPPPLAEHRPAGGRQLDHSRLAADAGLADPPSPVKPPRPSRHTMKVTVPAGHALEATRKVRWGAGSSCAESGAVPQL